MQRANSVAAAAATIPVLWSAKQVAEYCGVKERTVYKWVSDGLLKLGEHYHRPTGTRKIRFDAVKVGLWFRGDAKLEVKL